MDTRVMNDEVEPYVREVLSQRFGQAFSEQPLVIGVRADGTPRTHKFDAVSVDGSIVAAIKSSSGRTAGGNIPAAKISAAFNDLYFLSRVSAKVRLFVVTDPDFHELIQPRFDGVLPERTALVLLPLSAALQARVDELKGRND